MDQSFNIDTEKGGAAVNTADVEVLSKSGAEPTVVSVESSPSDIPPTPMLQGRIGYWNAKVERITGLESRGITRVLPSEKIAGGIQDYLQMFFLWYSIDLIAYNIVTGFLGTLVFSLGWVDCIVIVIFANAVAVSGVAYLSMFGPESGNRTMVSWLLLDDLSI